MERQENADKSGWRRKGGWRGGSGADIPLPAFAKKFLFLFIFLSDRRDLMLEKVKVAAKKDSILIPAVFFFCLFVLPVAFYICGLAGRTGLSVSQDGLLIESACFWLC